MKLILPVLVSIGLALTLCACGSGPQQEQKSAGTPKGAIASDGKSVSQSSFVPAESDVHQTPREKVAKAQLVSQNQSFSLKCPGDPSRAYDFTFQLKSTAVSKKLTGFQKADIDLDYLDYLKATVDASGNFTSGGSYVYLDFMVKNSLSKEAKTYLNDCEIIPVYADNTIPGGGYELQALDKTQHGKNSKDIFLYQFKANEETTFRMLYILPDKEFKNNLYLEVNPTGINGNHGPEADYEAKRFIKLNLPG